jgi:hypothetical protein
MKRMNGINIDKWRVLNKPLFEAYIQTYKTLQDNPSLAAPEALVNAFEGFGILEALTKEGYGSAYTIAREIGIYYEDEGKFVLSKMAQSFLDGKLSYSDYLKYYCLNIEFLILNEVVHPFSEILEALKSQVLDKNEIAQKCRKLVPIGSQGSVIDCLRLFLNRCIEAELLIFQNGKYKLAYSYNLLIASLNKSSITSIEFDQKFISGDQKIAQKNIVTILMEREIPQLFKSSFVLISSSSLPARKNNENSATSRSENIDLILFKLNAEAAGLVFSAQIIQRFVASLCTKPFVILTGLSGSGKTKLAQSFVHWICESKQQYKIIPVGADWTNREPLLGYPNGLDSNSYITPDSGALQLIIEALKVENQDKPYFMILDEMNLSHVERYFADFLSIMESQEKLKLYSGEKRSSQYPKDDEPEDKYIVPLELEWPQNLFIIGTVNIDETTYMFSPKVLDRANVIEFRITPKEMVKFFSEGSELRMEKLFLNEDKSQGGVGQNLGKRFLEIAKDKSIIKIPVNEGEENILNKFFEELQNVGAEFGYRSATEMQRLIAKLGIVSVVDEDGKPLDSNVKIDIAIMQKLLPKLHGSRKKLVGPLETLAGFCLKRMEVSQPSDQNKLKTIYQQYIEDKDKIKWDIKYPISFEKIERMLKNVVENGFTSYAEA